MVTADLGACEWFVWDLRRSNLVDQAQLDQLVHEFLQNHPGAEPPGLAEHLVSNGVLTQFQCERLLQGKTQGFVLGPFTLMDVLGTGSMGTVYKAQSKTDGGCYAVKVLPRRSMWNVRLARRKVRAFDHIKHSAVVPFVDVGTAGGMHYLAWPFIEGESLDKHLEKIGKLDPAVVCRIAEQIAQGLAVSHSNGLIHGLLKPSNLLLTAQGELRILDFGIGCLLSETEGESLVDTMSTANSVSSGLDCASPESILDPTNLTPAGDQYSLGCVLYYCLTGQYPYPDGSAVEKMMAHQTKKARPISELTPNVPAALIEIVERLMQKDPLARFPDANDVAEALQQHASGTTASGLVRPLPANRGADPRRARSGALLPRLSAAPETVTEQPAVSSGSRCTPRAVPRVTPTAPLSRPVLPVSKPAATSSPKLPTRQSIMMSPVPAKASAVRPPARPQLRSSASRPRIPAQPAPKQEQGMGSFGVSMLALLVCLVVWLLGRLLF